MGEGNQPSGANGANNGTSSKVESIWLEIANVRSTGKRVEIQVKGERTDREPAWLMVQLKGEDSDTVYRRLLDGLDKKRIVLAELIPVEGQKIECKHIRIQYAESASR